MRAEADSTAIKGSCRYENEDHECKHPTGWRECRSPAATDSMLGGVFSPRGESRLWAGPPSPPPVEAAPLGGRLGGGAPGGDQGTGGLPPSTWPRPQLCRFRPPTHRVSRGSQDKPGGGGYGDPDLQKPRPTEGTSQLGLPGNRGGGRGSVGAPGRARPPRTSWLAEVRG